MTPGGNGNQIGETAQQNARPDGNPRGRLASLVATTLFTLVTSWGPALALGVLVFLAEMSLLAIGNPASQVGRDLRSFEAAYSHAASSDPAAVASILVEALFVAYALPRFDRRWRRPSQRALIRLIRRHYRVPLVLGVAIGVLAGVLSLVLDGNFQIMASVPRPALVPYVAAMLVVASSRLVSVATQEIAFRGFVFRQLRATWGPLGAILLSSVLFTLYYVGPANGFALAPWMFLFGILFAWCYHKTTDLRVAISLHWGLNLGILWLNEWVYNAAPDVWAKAVWLPRSLLVEGATSLMVAGVAAMLLALAIPSLRPRFLLFGTGE